MDNVKFDTIAAAQYLGVSKFTLEMWRTQKKGPRFLKFSAKRVFYFKQDLDAFMEAHMCATSQQA